MSNDVIYRYWGKGDPEYSGVPKWHPAILHMLDVACVVKAFLDAPGSRRDALLRVIPSIDAGVACGWLCFVAALHDFGKVTPGFQSKLPEHALPLQALGFPFQARLDEGDHKPAGYVLLSDLFRERGNCESSLARILAQIPAAHHGHFLLGQELQALRVRCGGDRWGMARQEIAEVLRGLFGLEWNEFPWRDAESLPTTPLLLLSGLIAVADWIGSDSSHFFYCDATALELKGYWEECLHRAERIIAVL